MDVVDGWKEAAHSQVVMLVAGIYISGKRDVGEMWERGGDGRGGGRGGRLVDVIEVVNGVFPECVAGFVLVQLEDVV